MKARCEIDLSPGGLTRPLSGPLRRADRWTARSGACAVLTCKACVISADFASARTMAGSAMSLRRSSPRETPGFPFDRAAVLA